MMMRAWAPGGRGRGEEEGNNVQARAWMQGYINAHGVRNCPLEGHARGIQETEAYKCLFF
jgi:hypothetical protein